MTIPRWVRIAWLSVVASCSVAASAAPIYKVELADAILRLRFEQGLPIREIAALWKVDAAKLHHEYAKARNEFREALVEVVAFHTPGSKSEVERQTAELIELAG